MPDTANNQSRPSQLQNNPPLEEMIQFIIAQIPSLSLEQVRLMTYQEIIDTYQTLLNPPVENVPEDATVTNPINLQENIPVDPLNRINQQVKERILSIGNEKNVPQSTPKQPQTIKKVQINGSLYYQPSLLNKNNYKVSNKRFALICKPEPYTIQQKRQLVCTTFNPAMIQTIRSLRNQQIEQTYENLKNINKAEIYVPNALLVETPENKPPKPKQFVIYLDKCIPTQEELRKFMEKQCKERKNKDNKQPKEKQRKQKQIIKQKQNKENIPNSPKSKASKGSKEKKLFELPQPDQDFPDEDDQFFSQAPKPQPAFVIQKQKEKQKEREKLVEKEQPFIIVKPEIKQRSIRETFQSVKEKCRIENSTQTDPIKIGEKRQRKIKTKITVINQVQYIEDGDDEPIVSQKRPRPIQIMENDQQMAIGIPHKALESSFRRALTNPGQNPDPEILSWVHKMKNLLNKLQHQYCSLFPSSEWNINDD